MLIAVVIASFFDEFETLLFVIISIFNVWFCVLKLLIISTELSSEASSTKRISKKCFGYSKLESDCNKSDRFSASFLKPQIA